MKIDEKINKLKNKITEGAVAKEILGAVMLVNEAIANTERANPVTIVMEHATYPDRILDYFASSPGYVRLMEANDVNLMPVTAENKEEKIDRLSIDGRIPIMLPKVDEESGHQMVGGQIRSSLVDLPGGDEMDVEAIKPTN